MPGNNSGRSNIIKFDPLKLATGKSLIGFPVSNVIFRCTSEKLGTICNH